MYKLIVSIVPHNSGELITSAAVKAGAGGGTIIMGKGTASSNIIQLLGLGDSLKDIVYIIVDKCSQQEVSNKIIEATDSKKQRFGVMFNINVGDFIKSGNLDSENCENSAEKGETMASYKMINVIVNKGFAEDAMAAARKAGAGGGTIIGARGTAREGDAKFFGMEIVPEKEMLMIVVPVDKADAVVNAIKEVPCLSKAGSGVIFCQNAHDFTLLGKK